MARTKGIGKKCKNHKESNAYSTPSRRRPSSSHTGQHGSRAPNKRKNSGQQGDVALADITGNCNGEGGYIFTKQASEKDSW